MDVLSRLQSPGRAHIPLSEGVLMPALSSPTTFRALNPQPSVSYDFLLSRSQLYIRPHHNIVFTKMKNALEILSPYITYLLDTRMKGIKISW